MVRRLYLKPSVSGFFVAFDSEDLRRRKVPHLRLRLFLACFASSIAQMDGSTSTWMVSSNDERAALALLPGCPPLTPTAALRPIPARTLLAAKNF
jgi:hypothetical protein